MRRLILFVTAVVLILLLSSSALAAEGSNNQASQHQGNSQSNPDGGGVDKPYAADSQPAGSQGPDYHDGNNGCGQDKRSGEPRETGTERSGWDDNNGWCGKPPFAGRGEESAPSESSKVLKSNVEGAAGISGSDRGAPAGAVSEVLGVKVSSSTQVLGASGALGSVKSLATTGMNSVALAIVGLQMIAGGMMMTRISRRSLTPGILDGEAD